MKHLCPCGSGVDYSQCCGRYHSGAAQPATAEALMRSRYSAFVSMQTQYLLDSWHASKRPESLAMDNSAHWIGLEILGKEQGAATDSEGRVEFVARYIKQDRLDCIQENSRFIKEGGRWFYVDGEIVQHEPVKVGRNDPCPCGSGKKFKRCCGS